MPAHPPELLATLPIPSYEEATSSRPTTSDSRLGPAEASDDAERQALLADEGADTSNEADGGRRKAYQAPTVESARNSSDSNLTSLASTRSSDDRLRREVSQMDIEEPAFGYIRRGPSQFRTNITKRLTYITQSLSSISLPFQGRLPSFASLRERILLSPTPTLIIMGRLFALLLIFAVVYFFVSEINLGRGSLSGTFDSDSIRDFIQGHVDVRRLEENMKHLTEYDHLAGTQGDYFLADYVLNEFTSVGLDQTERNR